MVRITVLGALTAQVAGAAANLGGPRQRGVLAQLLVARGEAVPAERLIDNLWGGTPPAKATVSLQAYVSNLRRLLEPGRGPRQAARVLVSEARGYALRAVATDAEEFERLLADARARAGHGDRQTLRQALDLWRGGPYAEFADEPWAAAEITRLAELRLAARELAVARDLESGHAADAVPDALALAEEQPLREEGWRLLALALWRTGRQADALAALRRARRTLADELGLDPGPALTTLETAILHHRTDLLGTPAATTPTPAPGALPLAPLLPALPALPAETASGGLSAGVPLLPAGLAAGLPTGAPLLPALPAARGLSAAARPPALPAPGGLPPDVLPPAPLLPAVLASGGLPSGADLPLPASAGSGGVASDGSPGGCEREGVFVGREAELRVLREAAGEARGRTAVVLLSGEAGAGKSTLLGRFRRELLDTGWLVAAGRCPETEGAPPAWAWTEALRELDAQCPPDPGSAHALAPLLTETGLMNRQDALAGRFQLHRAVLARLHHATRRAPVAVLLDDLHAADPETLALVADLAADRSSRDLLLVVSHRPGEGELTDTLALLARRSPHRLPLTGLAEPDAGRLIAAICADPVDPATVQALTERTGGNPFYLVESAQLLAGEGALVAVQEVPQGVRDVLRRRFDRLPPAAAEALRLTAVAGREAEVDLLLHAGGLGEDALLDALDAALAGGLLAEPRPGTVRFTHALVRDTLYADLTGLRRARLHGRIAEALRALRPDRLAALAHHYTRAASAATAELAVDYCVRAAEAAERRYAHVSCAALLQQALDNLDRVPDTADTADPADSAGDRPARRIALLGALLRAQVRTGAIAAANAVKAEALRLARESGREDLLIEAWTAWTEPTPWVAHAYGSFDQSAVDSLTALLRRTDLPPATRCRLLDALTYELDCQGDDAAWAIGAEAVAIARAEGDPRLLALALAAQARAGDHELDFGARAAIAAELGALAREHDLPAYRWHAEHLACTAAAATGDLPALRRHMKAAESVAEGYGLPELIDVGLCQQGMLAIAAGRTDQAAQLYGRAIAGLRARGSVHAEGFGALVGFILGVQQGRIGDLLPVIEHHRAGYGMLVADLHALALVADGRPDEARAARRDRKAVPPDYYRSLFLVLRAAAVIALDEREEAAELIDELRPLRDMVAGSASTSVVLRPVALALGELARLLGREAEAAEYFRRAIEVARRWESPHWEAEARAQLGGHPQP